MNEKQVQQYAVELFKIHGCRVMSTSQVRRSKVSIGLPDLFIRKDSWITGVWIGIEIKGDKTKTSPEQTQLVNSRAIFILRGFDAREGVQVIPELIRELDSQLKRRTS